MLIKNLVLQQFRNFSKADLHFTKAITVFVGNNGQGKTNLVESLVFLATGRSFRVRDDSVLIQHKQVVATIDAVLESGKHLKVAISSKGKHMVVNGGAVSKVSDFIGHCNVILFAPDDLSFFTDSKRRRRHDIDLELGKISKGYLKLLGDYNKMLSERNALLKQPQWDLVYMDLVTNSLIDKMLPIIKQRLTFSQRLEPHINKIYRFLTQDTSEIKIIYNGPLNDSSYTHGNLKLRFDASLERDKHLKASQIGIHRDDFTFMMDGNPINEVASQGQRRMIMLAYKLAVLFLVKEKTGSYPILCLDDLFSELDKVRRQRVLKLLPEAVQVFITTTDISFIETNRDIQIVHVNNGEISIDREVHYVN